MVTPHEERQAGRRQAEGVVLPPEEAGVGGLQDQAGGRDEHGLLGIGAGRPSAYAGQGVQVRALAAGHGARVGLTGSPHPHVGREGWRGAQQKPQLQ